MRTRKLDSHTAGMNLWDIAEQYKQFRSDLSDKDTFKLAMLGNPDLAETYLGREVRRDAVDEVKRYLLNG